MLTTKEKLLQVKQIATNLMYKHGLLDEGWRFGFDRAVRRAGKCSYHRKLIFLSYHFCLRNTDEEILDTIKHEIAHALTGPGHGHNHVWKRKCIEVGAKPVRCYGSDVTMPQGKWRAECAECKQEFIRHRRPGRACCCRRCGRNSGVLVWYRRRRQ